MRRRRGRSKGTAKATDPLIGKIVDVTIDDLGSNGDGVGQLHGMPVYTGLALPGDRLSVRLTARRGRGYAGERVEAHRLEPRQLPVCGHFGTCGGCRLQHLKAADYLDWKRRQIEAALLSRGLAGITVKPLIDGHLGSRRRLRLAFRHAGGRMLLGFRRRFDRDLVMIDECPIAMPAIVGLLQPLRQCLGGLDMVLQGGEVTITAALNGLDLLLETPIEPALADREALAAFADEADLARLAWRSDAGFEPEPLAVRRQSMVAFGGLEAALPSGAFLQASEAAEFAIREAVASAIGQSRKIADLFAGCGALSLPLVGGERRLHAFERAPAMIRTLEAAARSAGLGARVTATVRDLDREPLGGAELGPFDALIIDPPRAGARPQVDAIAAAPGPEKIAMVSCNPSTFARGARVLVDAGYRLAWVQPIDAFLFAAEIELVGAFERAIAP